MEEHVQETSKRASALTIPASIILAGIIIALAVVYTNKGPAATPVGTSDDKKGDIIVQPVSRDEHIRGNPNAPVVVIEYSDLECPFCKQFQTTMKKVMDEYGTKGQVAWVYRHLPLAGLHPKAHREAEASECVYTLGGDEKFWAYVDKIFEVTPSNNGLDPSLLPEIAGTIGIDRAKFQDCLDKQEFVAKVDQSIKEAIAAGAQGTPYSIIITKNNQKTVISGAQPYSEVKQMLDTALAQK